MNRSLLFVLVLLLCTPAHAQVGAATPPATPGTSLGSGGLPSPGSFSGERASETEMCERLRNEEREKCLRALVPRPPGLVGPGSTGMGSGRGGNSAGGPGTGTAPGMPTR